MIPWLGPDPRNSPFPPVEQALEEPNGLLAAGGDLEPARLLRAYRLGIFPWYSEDYPILWWCPDPRAVLFPSEVRVPRRLRRLLRQHPFALTVDTAFADVVTACAGPRSGDSGTWITDAMAAAYSRLHELGYAHSIEVWRNGELVGGLYGVAMGHVFFGESMFSRVSNASKVALIALCRRLAAWDEGLLDCQIHSPHLAALGAREIPRARFQRLVAAAGDRDTSREAWRQIGWPQA